MLTKSRLSLAIGIISALGSHSASADQYHYINMLVGDRAAGLAGAYTAVSDDPTGLFYNPAGIVYSPGSSLTGSMNTYQESKTSYKNVLGGQYDWDRSSSTFLPNFFGMVQPMGAGTIGFSYAVPNSIIEDQDQTFDNIATTVGTANKFIINFNNTDNTYNFGPSYAYKLSPDLSIGATLYFHYRQQQRIANTILLYNGDRYWYNEYLEIEERGVKPILGVMWSPTEKISLGASVSQTSITSSTATSHQSCIGANGSTYTAADLCQNGNVINHQIIASDTEGEYPLTMNFGGAWFANDALMVSADMNYYEAYGTGVDARDSVINLAIGSEYYLKPSLALRAGFYTDLANTPELQQGFTAYNQPDHVDLYGISASISHFTRNSSLTFGFTYNSGSGKAQISSGSTVLQDVEMESIGVYIAASYAY